MPRAAVGKVDRPADSVRHRKAAIVPRQRVQRIELHPNSGTRRHPAKAHFISTTADVLGDSAHSAPLSSSYLSFMIILVITRQCCLVSCVLCVRAGNRQYAADGEVGVEPGQIDEPDRTRLSGPGEESVVGVRVQGPGRARAQHHEVNDALCYCEQCPF